MLDQEIHPSKGKAQYHTLLPDHVTNIRTDFFFRPEENVRPTECLPVHQIRQSNAQVRRSECHKESFLNGKRFLVAEVFSPPRFAQAAMDEGFEARSYDLLNGYDFRRKDDREAVRQELRKLSPDRLVLCPPCTHEGGWWHWNASQMTPEAMLKLRRQSRLYIRFCCELYEEQLERGKQAMFEHPLGSKAWTYPEVRRLMDRCHLIKRHMCRYGLKLPNSKRLIRKATGLLLSDSSMVGLGWTCPGKCHPDHDTHDIVAGSCAGVG